MEREINRRILRYEGATNKVDIDLESSWPTEKVTCSHRCVGGRKNNHTEYIRIMIYIVQVYR